MNSRPKYIVIVVFIFFVLGTSSLMRSDWAEESEISSVSLNVLAPYISTQRRMPFKKDSLIAQAGLYYSGTARKSAVVFTINPFSTSPFADALSAFISKFNDLKKKIKKQDALLAPYIDELLHIYDFAEQHIIVAATQKYGFPATENIELFEDDTNADGQRTKITRFNKSFYFEGESAADVRLTQDGNVIIIIKDDSELARMVQQFRESIPQQFPELGCEWKKIRIVHITVSRINFNAIAGLSQDKQTLILEKLRVYLSNFVSEQQCLKAILRIDGLAFGYYIIPGQPVRGAVLVKVLSSA